MRSLLILGVLAAGCGPTVAVKDDVDIDWDFIELTGPSNSMHTPYVIGSSMNVWVESSDKDEKMDGWTVESSDPSIFAIDTPQLDEHHHLYVACHGVGDGTADVIVRDSGKHQRTRYPVEVRTPDRAQVMAHGLLIIGRTEQQSSVNDVRILNGGTATFLLHYYQGDRTLYGNGALSVDAPTDVVATTPRTYLFEARDWLQVTPSHAGTSSLGLRVNNVHFADVPLTVAAESDIASVKIVGMDEAHAKKDQWLVALGQAFDASNNQIFGVAFNWDIDGQAQTGWDGDTGDLYRYKFDPAKPKMLAANYGSVSAVAMIHWGGGYVDSSNSIGCSAAPGRPGTSLPMFSLVIGIGLLIRARARARAREEISL